MWDLRCSYDLVSIRCGVNKTNNERTPPETLETEATTSLLLRRLLSVCLLVGLTVYAQQLSRPRPRHRRIPHDRCGRLRSRKGVHAGGTKSVCVNFPSFRRRSRE